MKGPLDTYRDAELSPAELAKAASSLAAELGLKPDDGRVGPITERTIRYYQGRGLLEVPRRSGRQAVYSLLHLLQVLTLRRLQADGHSLDDIDDLIDSGELSWRSVSSLERALTMTGRADRRSAAKEPDAAYRYARRAGKPGGSKAARRRRQQSESVSMEYMAAASPAESPHPAAPGALEEELIRRMEQHVEHIVMRHVDRRLAHLADELSPRIESMLEHLLERKLEPGEHRVTREVRPGVNVQIDTSRVEDPEEVLGRIEEAISDDG